MGKLQLRIEDKIYLASMVVILFHLVKDIALPRQQVVKSGFYKIIQSCSSNKIIPRRRATNHIYKTIKKYYIRQGEGETNIRSEKNSQLFAKYVRQVFKSNIENALEGLANTWIRIQQLKLKLLKQENVRLNQKRLKKMPDFDHLQIKQNLQKIFNKEIKQIDIKAIEDQVLLLLPGQSTIEQQQQNDIENRFYQINNQNNLNEQHNHNQLLQQQLNQIRQYSQYSQDSNIFRTQAEIGNPSQMYLSLLGNRN